ncbi:Organic cation/carnitine transporter 4 [Apostasia shenzhenica]|uniref:H(+)/Pi cotransporter n=1 Tax=Apostasia shenzhenica TaxID=1088818 RepID=A0A2I0ADB3_9ASPA|nr:Organic cation/carnitine transporter 4 [Apostasia shenzhenica]
MPARETESSGDLTVELLPTANSDGEEEGIGVDEMLERFAGEFGPWQLRQFLLTSIAWALNSIHTMAVVFADREPAGPDPCGAASRAGEWAGSTVEEWHLACGGERYKVGLAQSAFFAGSMIGAAIFGHLSDSFLGRKGALTVASGLNATFGLLTAFSPSFSVYAAFRLLTGVSTGGVGLSAFVLATEPIGRSRRAAAAMSSFYFSSAGAVALSAIALLIPSWRHLYVATSIPSLLFVLLAIPFISESPRWHLVHRNPSAAMSIIRAIANSNGSFVPGALSLTLDAYPGKVSPGAAAAVSSSIIDVLRSRLTRSRLVLAVLINLLGSIVYYGLTLNVGNLGSNLHFSVILNAVAEVPAYMLTAMAVSGLNQLNYY